MKGGENNNMQTIDKFIMFFIAVKDMSKVKEFYADKLGLKVKADYRQDDNHWWVSLTLPEGGVTISLTTFPENLKPGTMKMYFTTSDLAATHKELSNKGVKVNEIKSDLYGPGSGIKWFNLEDPEGNQVFLVQA